MLLLWNTLLSLAEVVVEALRAVVVALEASELAPDYLLRLERLIQLLLVLVEVEHLR